MTDTLEDAEREAFFDAISTEILESHRDAIVSEFIEDRLASYFEEHPNLSLAAQEMLEEARRLSETSAAATLVFALSSVEISIRDVLLRPIFAGLTHNPELGNIVSELVDLRNKKTFDVLTHVMDEIGLPKLKEQKLQSGRLVWDEKSELQKLRNLVVHRGEKVSTDQATRSIGTAKLGSFWRRNGRDGGEEGGAMAPSSRRRWRSRR